MRRSLLLLLKGRGFDAVAYPAAAQALADAAACPPACLVTDFRLDDQDGIALHAAMLAGGWRGSNELADRARAAGVAAVFDKPLREHALVDTVRRLTDAKV